MYIAHTDTRIYVYIYNIENVSIESLFSDLGASRGDEECGPGTAGQLHVLIAVVLLMLQLLQGIALEILRYPLYTNGVEFRAPLKGCGVDIP